VLLVKEKGQNITSKPGGRIGSGRGGGCCRVKNLLKWTDLNPLKKGLVHQAKKRARIGAEKGQALWPGVLRERLNNNNAEEVGTPQESRARK